ncbi:hypothetical protein Mapa_012782 [Marchantia paleacea]|nr:hypothetical protein Mapa_012782 [Marchantia paleacea]
MSCGRECCEDHTDEERNKSGQVPHHILTEILKQAGADVGSHERARGEDHKRKQGVHEVAESELVFFRVRGLEDGRQLRSPQSAETDHPVVHFAIRCLEAVREAGEETEDREEDGRGHGQP